MAPVPTESFVTWADFKWFIGGVVGTQLAIGGMLLGVVKWVLGSHSDLDDDRFDQLNIRFNKLESRLEVEHAENKAAIANLKADMLLSNQGLLTEFRDTRRFFEEYLLRRLPPAA